MSLQKNATMHLQYRIESIQVQAQEFRDQISSMRRCMAIASDAESSVGRQLDLLKKEIKDLEEASQ